MHLLRGQRLSQQGDEGGSEYLLQFEDAAKLGARTQTVQKAPVNLQCKVLQFNTVTLSKESIQINHIWVFCLYLSVDFEHLFSFKRLFNI